MRVLAEIFNFDYWWIKLWIIAVLMVIITLIAYKNLWLNSYGKLRTDKIGVYIVIVLYAIILVCLMLRIYYLLNTSQDALSLAGGVGDGVLLLTFIGPTVGVMFSYLRALRRIKTE